MIYWKYDTKRTTGSMLDLSIKSLKKYGYLEKETIKAGGISWSNSFRKEVIGSIGVNSNTIVEKPYIELSYMSDHKDEMQYKVYLTTTKPYFGGVRYWFLCPNCNQRVGILYGGKYFCCRKCHNLSYQSQNEGHHSRLISKYHKITDKIKDKNGFITKPKGMHWKTFYKIQEQANDAETKMVFNISKRFGLVS